MAESIIEQIAVNIAETVDAITTAAGYQQDLVAVRPKRIQDIDLAADGAAYIEQGLEEPDDSQVTGTYTAEQTFMLTVAVIDSDRAEDSIDTRINRAVADIQKAMLIDPWRNSLAIDTKWGPVQRFSDGESMTGAVVEIIVKYRVSESDPYTKG